MNTQQKPRLSFWQIWNMSFGFLGIQYGFGLQQANLSPIFRYLDADESKLPMSIRITAKSTAPRRKKTKIPF